MFSAIIKRPRVYHYTGAVWLQLWLLSPLLGSVCVCVQCALGRVWRFTFSPWNFFSIHFVCVSLLCRVPRAPFHQLDDGMGSQSRHADGRLLSSHFTHGLCRPSPFSSLARDGIKSINVYRLCERARANPPLPVQATASDDNIVADADADA